MAFVHKGEIIKRLGFIGFGKSNRGVYSYLKKFHPELEFSIRLEKNDDNLPENASFFIGKNQFDALSEDVLFVSPVIRRDRKVLSGKLLSSDAELFFEKNKNDCFALTGSDGKSTTASLTAKLIEGSYDNSFASGNIGNALTPHLEDEGKCAYVTELSSFQLMNFSPRAKRTLITNITPNHLDWHKSYEEYIGAKENILKLSAENVFSADSPPLKAFIEKYGAYALFSSVLSENEIQKLTAQIYVYIKNGAVYLNGKKQLEISEIRRNEEYNIKNLMAAMALGYGYWNEDTLHAVASSFSGLEHRYELIDKFSGVKFYNSSIDSSPERTLATLGSASGASVIILGGKTKMKNFEILRPILKKIAHALVLTGENRDEIYAKLFDIGIPVYIEEDFFSAVKIGAHLAKSCGNLILSPASTSFDNFKNYEMRGDAFKSAVSELKNKGL